MRISEVILYNFRKFKSLIFKANEKTNVIIGDNESGKSTILLAVDLCLSGSQNKIDSLGLDSLFNSTIIESFLNGPRNVVDLPKLFIEVYFNNTTDAVLEGNNNSKGREYFGVRLSIEPDHDKYHKDIQSAISEEGCLFPFEYYKIEFKTFSGSSYNSYNKRIKHIFIDNSNINSEQAMREYVSKIYTSFADNNTKTVHNKRFRDAKHDFYNNVIIPFNTANQVSFGLSTNNKLNLESNLILHDNNINIWNKGTGNQCIIKTKMAVQRQADNIDIILLEEPENHLSHINLLAMLDEIILANNKQFFITTHNNMICSRLGLRNSIFLGNDNTLISFDQIDNDTASFFMKLPTPNILNLVLAPKVVCVEGAAEFILFDKFYSMINTSKISEDKISLISVNGVSFLRYLEIACLLRKKIVIITDNDSDYETKVKIKYLQYQSNSNVMIAAETDNALNTFEVSLYELNKTAIDNSSLTSTTDKLKYMLNNKAESAFRILNLLENGTLTINIPQYIVSAFQWIKN